MIVKNVPPEERNKANKQELTFFDGGDFFLGIFMYHCPVFNIPKLYEKVDKWGPVNIGMQLQPHGGRGKGYSADVAEERTAAGAARGGDHDSGWRGAYGGRSGEA